MKAKPGDIKAFLIEKAITHQIGRGALIAEPFIMIFPILFRAGWLAKAFEHR